MSHSCQPLTLLTVMMVTTVRRNMADCDICRARCIGQTQTQFVVLTFFGDTKTMHDSECLAMKNGAKLLLLIMMWLLNMAISLKNSVDWQFNIDMVMLRRMK